MFVLYLRCTWYVNVTSSCTWVRALRGVIVFFFFPAPTVVCSTRVFPVFFYIQPTLPSNRHTACCGRSIARCAPPEFSRERGRSRTYCPMNLRPYTIAEHKTYENSICLMFFFFIRKQNIGTIFHRHLLYVMHWLSPLNSIPTDERCESNVPIQNGNKSGTTPGSRFG